MVHQGSFIQHVLKIYPEKNISYPLIRTQMCAYLWIRIVSILENVAYVLNKRSLMSSLKVNNFFFNEKF